MRGNFPLSSLCPLTMASMILGWSDPRFTKQWVTPALHSASKKADDAVYMAAVSSSLLYLKSVFICFGSRSGVQGSYVRSRGVCARGERQSCPGIAGDEVVKGPGTTRRDW